MSYHILHKSSHSYVEENRTVVRRPPNKRPLIKSAFQCCDISRLGCSSRTGHVQWDFRTFPAGFVATKPDVFTETSGHLLPWLWQENRIFLTRRLDFSSLAWGGNVPWIFPAVYVASKVDLFWWGIGTFPTEMSKKHLTKQPRFETRCRYIHIWISDMTSALKNIKLHPKEM